jgi:hypothetical protein
VSKSVVLLAASLFVCGSAGAQGIGEAAARERERRAAVEKSGKKSRVLTNADLEKGKTAGEQPANSRDTPRSKTSAPAAAAQRRTDSDDDERQISAETRDRNPEPPRGAKAERGSSEEDWRAEADLLKRRLADASAALADAEKQVQSIAGQLLLTTDTYEMMRLRQQKEAAEAQLAQARANVSAADGNLKAFEERARRAGVPPGWIR